MTTTTQPAAPASADTFRARFLAAVAAAATEYLDEAEYAGVADPEWGTMAEALEDFGVYVTMGAATATWCGPDTTASASATTSGCGVCGKAASEPHTAVTRNRHAGHIARYGQGALCPSPASLAR